MASKAEASVSSLFPSSSEPWQREEGGFEIGLEAETGAREEEEQGTAERLDSVAGSKHEGETARGLHRVPLVILFHISLNNLFNPWGYLPLSNKFCLVQSLGEPSTRMRE